MFVGARVVDGAPVVLGRPVTGTLLGLRVLVGAAVTGGLDLDPKIIEPML